MNRAFSAGLYGGFESWGAAPGSQYEGAPLALEQLPLVPSAISGVSPRRVGATAATLQLICEVAYAAAEKPRRGWIRKPARNRANFILLTSWQFLCRLEGSASMP